MPAEKPAYIDRYDYQDGKRPVYMEPPGFITGADRYVPENEVKQLQRLLKRARQALRFFDEISDEELSTLINDLEPR